MSAESHFSFAAARRISSELDIAGAIDVSVSTRPGKPAAPPVSAAAVAEALTG